MNHPHWQYYLSLVDDLHRLSRYIEISEDNFSTYSVELTRILLATGSEVDVVAKLLCSKTSEKVQPVNIVEYGEVLLQKYPGLTSVDVSVKQSRLEFKPWNGWTTTERPSWWSSYNNVKHERNNYFKEANLGNVLHAIGGLCVLLAYLHYDDFISCGGVSRPLLYLHSKYKDGGKIVYSPGLKLPDFN